MVAYSFHKIFAPQVEATTKRQTIRGQRRRHARPGEALQLYHGMRTTQCRKLLTPDPMCTAARQIVIEFSLGFTMPVLIEINGIALRSEAFGPFAVADGFDTRRWPAPVPTWARGLSAISAMCGWWGRTHDQKLFTGALIEWRPATGEST